jgi:hypothetical protein
MFFRMKYAQIVICLSLCLAACESRPSEQVKADAVEPVAAPQPEVELAFLSAEGGLVRALRTALFSTLRSKTGQITTNGIPPRVRESHTAISIFFGANNHGERNDCGCKKNPLGGLGRRHTLSQKEPAGDHPWWDKSIPNPNALFSVDAGDLFFRNVTLEQSSKFQQEAAKIDAQAVAESVGQMPIDAINVGANDLVFGLDHLRSLADKTNKAIISANLQDKSGNLVFPPSHVVERGGAKVAFVGLTKAKPRVSTYYSTRDLSADSPLKSYTKAVAALPSELDAVILLSNLGLEETRRVVRQLVEKNVRIDAAIISNSNRLTQTEWESGVPMVEPLSRGKYFGRLDLYLNEGRGSKLVYANQDLNTNVATDQYRRAASSYFSARSRLNKAQAELVALELEPKKPLQPATDGTTEGTTPPARAAAVVKEKNKIPSLNPGPAAAEGLAEETPTDARRNRLEKQAELFAQRVKLAYQTLSEISGQMSRHQKLAEAETPNGGAWVDVEITSLKLTIPEHAPIRNIIDRWEKKKPEPPARAERPGFKKTKEKVKRPRKTKKKPKP